LTLKTETAALAAFFPEVLKLHATSGQRLMLPVTVENRSDIPFPPGKATFGLSYHLLSKSRQLLKFDKARTYFEAPLAPGARLDAELTVPAPNEPGSYLLELDLVWELMWWAKEKGNPTCIVELNVV
jgi:hypothetical protein